MKFILSSIILISFLVTSCIDQPKKALQPNQENTKAQSNSILNDSSKYTTIHWENPEQNIGEITLGAKVQIKYNFKNTGTNPLYIIVLVCNVTSFSVEDINN